MNEHEPEADPALDPEQEARVRVAARRPRCGAATQRDARPTWRPGSTRPWPVLRGRAERSPGETRERRTPAPAVGPPRRRCRGRRHRARCGWSRRRQPRHGQLRGHSRRAGSGERREPLSPGPSDAPVPSAGRAPGSKSRALRESAEACPRRCRRSPRLPSTPMSPGSCAADAGVVTPDERSTDQPAQVRLTSEDPAPRQQSKTDALLTGRARARRSPTVPRPTRCSYDGVAAALLVHPEQDGERLVEAWTCDGDRGWTAPVTVTVRSPGDPD